MRSTLKDVMEFDIITGALVAIVDSQAMEFNVGLFFGWIKADKIAGTLNDEFTVGWKIKGADGVDRDDYFRPIFVDTNRAAENYNVPVYANMNDVEGENAGMKLVDSQYYPFVLFDPANPVPIPLLFKGDVIEFTVTGIGLAGADDFDITIELLALENQY